MDRGAWGQDQRERPPIESLKRTLAELLKDRACLLILDDIWQHTHANVFRVDAPRCRLLLTTRDTEIAHELGAQVYPIPGMTPDEATELLEKWAGEHLTEADSTLKGQIVKRLGYLPLAVKLTGAQLQWKAPEDWLRTFDIYELESLRPENQLHGSLVKTFLLSLDALDTSPLNRHARQLYLALAIFKEDEAAPQATIAKLWQGLAGLNATATDHLLHDLASRALLDLAPHSTSRAARLHDLMRDLIGTELGEEGRLAAHYALLSVYRTTCTGGGWHTAPNDGYLYDHLAYHLHQAKSWNELKSLFADHQWMWVRVSQHDYIYDDYVSDLSLALEHALGETWKQIEANEEPRSFADCFRYILIRTSINSVAGNYIPALTAQAFKEGLWTPERAMGVTARVVDAERRDLMYAALLETNQLNLKYQLEAAKAITNEQQRAEALLVLALQLDEPSRTEVLQAALDATQAAHQKYELAAKAHLSEQQRAVTEIIFTSFRLITPSQTVVLLRALVPQLIGPSLKQALEVAQAITHKESRALALGVLAPYLDEPARTEALQTALEAALVIENGKKPEVLRALAPHLKGPLLKQALEAAQAIEYKEAKALTLGSLALQLDEPARTQALGAALEAAQAIKDEKKREEMLKALAPQLTGPLLEQALEGGQVITDVENRAKVPGALATNLDKSARTETLRAAPDAAQAITDEQRRALDAAQAITDEQRRAEVLRTMAARLDEPGRARVLQAALEAAQAIRDEEYRAKALGALAPQLTGPLLEQALETAQSINDEISQVMALGTLAPYLDEPARARVLPVALDTARAIRDEGSRVWELGKLAPHLAEPTRTQVLRDALWLANCLEEEKDTRQTWARVLELLAPQLTGPLLEQALKPVQGYKEGWPWMLALRLLAPQLTGPLLERALKDAYAIRFEDNRAKVLGALVPQLAEPTRTEALQAALEAALTIQKEERRVQVLEKLTPQLTGTLLKQALEAAKAVENEVYRAKLLGALAPQLAEPTSTEVLQAALEAALSLTIGFFRAQSLASFLPVIADQQMLLASIRQALIETFSLSQQLSRHHVLNLLRYGPFRPPILSPETLDDIATHIIELCQEWHWL